MRLYLFEKPVAILSEFLDKNGTQKNSLLSVFNHNHHKTFDFCVY